MASLALLMRFVPLEREWMTKSYVRAGISLDRLNTVMLASVLISIGLHTTSTHAVLDQIILVYRIAGNISGH